MSDTDPSVRLMRELAAGLRAAAGDFIPPAFALAEADRLDAAANERESLVANLERMDVEWDGRPITFHVIPPCRKETP